MPSPLGHALGGLAAGWLVARPRESGDAPSGARAWQPRTIAFAALGMAADLDLLIGRHSQFTHSIGMALVVGAATLALLRIRSRRGAGKLLLLSAAAAAAYGSHVVLDWLAADATPPLGITALWPFSSAYYLSGLDVFWGISREPWRAGAAWHDVLAIARELLLLGPLAAGAWWLRRPRAAGWQNPHALPPERRQRVQSTIAPGLDGESIDGH